LTAQAPSDVVLARWRDKKRGRIELSSPRLPATRQEGSSVRDIDLLPAVTAALKLHKAQQAAERLKAGRGAPQPGQDYVFTGPAGGFLNVNALRDRVWYPTLVKAKLSRRTMYQTRHTFASNALAAGEAPSWGAAMLGHASPEMLFSVYARFIPNRTRRDGSALVSRMDVREARAESREG